MLIGCCQQAGRRETGGGHLQSGGAGVGGGAALVPVQHGVRETRTEQGDRREGVERHGSKVPSMLIGRRWQAGRRETGGGHLQSGGAGVGGGAAPVPVQHGVRETRTEQGDQREGAEGDQAEMAGSRTERGEHRERRQSSQRGGQTRCCTPAEAGWAAWGMWGGSRTRTSGGLSRAMSSAAFVREGVQY